MGSSKGPKQTAQQKELELISIEREKELRVENAKQTTKTFSDQLAFRRKLRGMFSLLSGGFKGFTPGDGRSGTPGPSSGSGVNPMSGSGPGGRGIGAIAPPARPASSGGRYRVGIAKG